MKVTELELKKQFEKVKTLTIKRRNEGQILDKMIRAIYGFNYSETDDDPIIDTLDYGTNRISFNNFKERMDEYKKQHETDKAFHVIP